MAKSVAERPEWLKAAAVNDIYSVSHCISPDFADFINYWKHNGYWLFDDPEIIRQLALEHAIDLTGTTLFYYEVHDQEFSEDDQAWRPCELDRSFVTNVIPPGAKQLEGFDVVTFFAQTSPECSPLSCNGLAAELRTNIHCLLPSLEVARSLVEGGNFRNSEPGPRRIFSVFTVQVPRWGHHGA